MKILVSGASGMVGSQLVPTLRQAGHEVVRLVRGGTAGEPNSVGWDPLSDRLDTSKLNGIDAIVHLAGDNVAEGRWTKEKKASIRDSRVMSTRLLAETMSRVRPRPKVFISASATGIYGDRGEEWLTEESSHGTDFLADVCLSWEGAAQAAKIAGIRVVHLRFGVILAKQGGALAKMVPPFKAGMGGPVGGGEQYISWIALEDALGVIMHALTHEELEGAVNVVSPEPVKNKDFAQALGHALGRPTLVQVPAFAVKLAFGEMAEATLLASQRVMPQKLMKSGYSYRQPELTGALRELLTDQ